MLITEELHLLLLRPDGRGEASAWSYRAYGEVAAVIVDLALHERVTVSEEKRPVVEVFSTQPTGHPVLDATLTRLAPLSGKRLSSLVQRSSLDPKDEIIDSLVAQHVLVRGERGFFGLGAVKTPEADPGPERLLRARLAAVIAGTAAPTAPDLTLLAILHAMNAAHAVLREEKGGLSSWQLKKRIEQLTSDSPAGEAVASAVSAVIMAVMTATIIPVVISTSTS